MSDHEERKAAEAAQMMRRLHEDIKTPQVRENLRVVAVWRRAKYEAHVAAGFTPGQALYLCALE